jgi:hypothetical protein
VEFLRYASLIWREDGKVQREWTPQRAFDLRLDHIARDAAAAVKQYGAHSDAVERLLRLFYGYLDHPRPDGPNRGSPQQPTLAR